MALGAALLLTLPLSPATANGGRVFYISPQGSDTNSGTSPSQAFETLAHVSNGFLQPGDTVLLQGGATFSDTLAVWSSGTPGARIAVDRYGTGSPVLTDGCLDVGGDHITVEHLLVTECTDDTGIWVYGADDVIQHNEATHNIQAVAVDSHATSTKILHNYVHDNDRMAPNTPGPHDDYGAIGIVLAGKDAEVAFNRLERNVATSQDFGEDGSAVEIYGGVRTSVHDNTAADNSTFTELGNPRSVDTTFTHNTVSSDLAYSQFLVTRGAGDEYYGPVKNTVATDNSVVLSGDRSTGYICYNGCTPELFTLRGNSLDVAGNIGYLEGSLGGGDNRYSNGSLNGIPLLPGDTYTPRSSPSPTPTTSPTTSPTPTITATPTASPSPTDTPTPTGTAAPTDTTTPTASPSSTDTATPTVTASPSETASPTESATPTISAMPTETAAPAASQSPTETASPTETSTPTSVTPTDTASPVMTTSPTATEPVTGTAAPTETTSATTTESVAASATPTRSATPTTSPAPTSTTTTSPTAADDSDATDGTGSGDSPGAPPATAVQVPPPAGSVGTVPVGSDEGTVTPLGGPGQPVTANPSAPAVITPTPTKHHHHRHRHRHRHPHGAR